MKGTPGPARGPGGGAVPGRRGACWAVWTPPAASGQSQVVETIQRIIVRLLIIWIVGFLSRLAKFRFRRNTVRSTTAPNPLGRVLFRLATCTLSPIRLCATALRPGGWQIR